MADRWVMTMVLFVALVGSVSNLGTTAYGDSPYDGGSNPSQDTSILDGVFSLVSGAVDVVLSFVEGFVPNFTGIWVIDDLIINPLIAYATYVGVTVILGVVN